jgi:hypothetical protein
VVTIRPILPARLKDLSEKDLLEAIAGELVGTVTDTTLKKLDPGGGRHQLPDFEILDVPGGMRVGLLEVTTTTRRTRIEYSAQLHRQNWQFPNLTWWWLIHTDGILRPDRLHDALEPILEAWEAAGPPTETVPSQPGLVHPDPGSVPPDLSALGVVSISALNPQPVAGQAWVVVHRHEVGVWFNHRTALTSEVQAELNKADNQAKLQGSPGRSELFVWLDVGAGAAAALTLVDPPWDQTLHEVALPILPAGVTAVWAATGRADWPRPATSLLRCDGARWEDILSPVLP